ncbi:MAG: YtxH domain-containing protein [candidate division KSB1 bacterium]|nr:YtxH domain-containing protein [candidate division KSB1 bacterium]MDZ7337656.1 YtxH domain-containing protein [candidate division KSB1 bacterium]MDZ7385667.1 YtxH domain-containing protein [candidate division KSB1 bacterium]MDZ7393608.1 YtxH domain-containing protein [candidate division KSB1 bacterium]
MNKETGAFVKGLLIGGAVGAILALLYAPKSGKETREDIKRRTEEFLEEADRELAELKRRAANLVSQGRRKAEELAEEAEERVEKTKGAIAEKTGRLRRAVEAGARAFAEEKGKQGAES